MAASRRKALATQKKKQLRALWLQVHKWIGLTLAVLIIPISLTGSALVWHDWLDSKLEPQRFATLGPASLAPAAYADSARSVLADGQRLSTSRTMADRSATAVIGGRPG